MGTSKCPLVSAPGPRYIRRMASPIRLFRVIAPVSNLEEAARFYSAIFDNPGFRISPGRHYFECGGVILAVYDAVADGDAQPVHHNGEHIYFAVSDLDAVFTRAEKAGGLSTAVGDGNLPMGKIAKRPWGEVSFYLHDPSGNPLCFVDE